MSTSSPDRCSTSRARGRVILQLSKIKYLDSAGFAALDRLLEQNAIVLVLSPDSFMYRVAELMCLPIHHDAETARRVLQENPS